MMGWQQYHKGTVKIQFLPPPILARLHDLGYGKSKSGNMYKVYGDYIKEDMLVVVSCAYGEPKTISFWAKGNESNRRIDWAEALVLSAQFKHDFDTLKAIDLPLFKGLK